jgi:molecular chaperone GrpE
LSSEEQHRREEELPDNESAGEVPPPQQEHNDKEISEPVEVGVSEDPGVVIPEVVDPGATEEEPEAVPEEEAETAHEEVLALAKELKAVREERDEYLNDMLRMRAELENSRKRLERERARIVQLASERLMRELLPVMDNLERAIEAEGDIREGVRATHDQLVGVLARQGLEPVTSDGEIFDPAFHEAVMTRPSDEHEEDTVLQTLERGYILNGRPLRPAKVIVASR